MSSPRTRAWHNWAPAVALLIHAFLSINAWHRLSPTWDEIAYPAAGLVQVESGQLRLNTVNPFLSKIFYALPLLATKSELPFSDPSWTGFDEYRFGFEFTFRNVVDARHLVFLSRLPLLFFSLLTALILYFWIRSLWGPVGAFISLLAYLSTPVFLSRAAVAQLEMPMFAFMMAALWLHFRWFETNRRLLLVASGVAIGLGALCKLVILPLLPAVVILNLFFHPDRPALKERFLAVMILSITVPVIVVGAYLPWPGGWAAFTNMAQNVVTFDKILPYYWAGRTYAQAPSLFSLAGFFLKAPLHVLALGVWGAWVWKRSRLHSSAFWHFAVLTVASLGTVFFFKNAVSTIQLSPAYLGLVALAGALALVTKSGWHRGGIVAAILIIGTADVMAVHPNYLAYFNRLAGGSDQGYRWLADSDQDWGQSLPVLAEYLKKHAVRDVVLCYSGSGDPSAYGIQYQDLLSPALVTRDRTDSLLPSETGKTYLVIATKVLQSEAPYFTWIQANRRPIAVVGQTFMVYDLSKDREAFEWMSAVYRQTNRPALERLSLERAKGIRAG